MLITMIMVMFIVIYNMMIMTTSFTSELIFRYGSTDACIPLIYCLNLLHSFLNQTQDMQHL